MAKKKVSETAVQIRKLLASKKLVIGADRTIKLLKTGKLNKIFLSSGCADKNVETITRYAKMAGIEIKKLRLPSDELGVVCKKPFSISVLGVLKGK
jgi:large subunit ribosomal protein L30e